MEWDNGKMVTEVRCYHKYALVGEDISVILTGNEMPKAIGKRFKITFEELD